MVKFNVITLFPEMIHSYLQLGVVGQAVQKKMLIVECINPRDYAGDVHKTVDDRPFGGGDGMVMKAEPLDKLFEDLKKKNELGTVYYLSPQGKTWSDQIVRNMPIKDEVDGVFTLLCGRYGGVDQRVLNKWVHQEISIGDYVLSGGELGALVLIDSISRFIPGVLGHEDSAMKESFSDNKLEAPLFTRPAHWEGELVPQTLLSGNHSRIKSWREDMSLLVTLSKRPDLFKKELPKAFEKAKSLLNKFSEEDLVASGVEVDVLSKIIGRDS